MRKLTFEIEDYDGNTIMAFEIGINDGEIDLLQTRNCSLANIEGDYIFNTNNQLIRVQSEQKVDFKIR